MVVIGLGICTVTLWTPFPVRRTAAGADRGGSAGGLAMSALAEPPEDTLTLAVTDDEPARALTDEVLLARPVDDVPAPGPADPVHGPRKPEGHLATPLP